MKKKIAKGKPRRQPKQKKANASPWHKYRTVPPRVARNDEIINPPVADLDSLSDEVAEIESDPDSEPEETLED